MFSLICGSYLLNFHVLSWSIHTSKESRKGQFGRWLREESIRIQVKLQKRERIFCIEMLRKEEMWRLSKWNNRNKVLKGNYHKRLNNSTCRSYWLPNKTFQCWLWEALVRILGHGVPRSFPKQYRLLLFFLFAHQTG